MSRATMSRLARLEAVRASAKSSSVWHQVIGDSMKRHAPCRPLSLPLARLHRTIISFIE